MSSIKLKYLLFIFLVYFSSSLAGGEESFHAPISSPEKLIKYAQRIIIVNQIPIDDYYLEGVTYSYMKQHWYFSYFRKDTLGASGAIDVRINDKYPNETIIIK